MKTTNEDLKTWTIEQLIRHLVKYEDLTVREHNSLPTLYDAFPADGPYLNERMIAKMSLGEIERLMALARLYFVTA
jgi:hypothetical protein